MLIFPLLAAFFATSLGLTGMIFIVESVDDINADNKSDDELKKDERER